MNLKSKSKLLLGVMLFILNLSGIAPTWCVAVAGTDSPSRAEEMDARRVHDLIMLHDAAWNGDLATVNRLIAHGVDVNGIRLVVAHDGNIENRLTALDLAVRRGNLDIVETLLDNGANPNLPGIMHRTPLIWAARSTWPNRLAMVNTLLSHGADPNLPDQNGDTSLIGAVERNHYDVASVLLAHGAEVNSRGFLNTTALIEAIKNGSPQIIRLLLGYGADINVEDDYGNTPFSVAIVEERPQVLELLRVANNSQN